MTERLKNKQFSRSNYRQTTAGRLVSSIVNLKVILNEVICNDVFKSNNVGKQGATIRNNVVTLCCLQKVAANCQV